MFKLKFLLYLPIRLDFVVWVYSVGLGLGGERTLYSPLWDLTTANSTDLCINVPSYSHRVMIESNA